MMTTCLSVNSIGFSFRFEVVSGRAAMLSIELDENAPYGMTESPALPHDERKVLVYPFDHRTGSKCALGV